MLRFAVTVVLSAFLLFLVQPLVGKVVLPWFGGAPAVWTTCLLFFQLVLLGGYAWSHLVVRRLQGPWQRRAHVLLLATALGSLVVTTALWGTPLVPSSSLRPEGSDAPTLRLLMLLGLSVGLPYFALSSTGPLLQAWVSQRVPAVTAMRLYAASNVGSLVGLLAFPVLFEPLWPLRSLAWAWAAGFTLFAVLCASLAWGAPVVPRDAANEAKLEARTVAGWIILAALPSALLLATTNHLTQDVAPIPFLWVLPLVLYLASFVITFDSDRWYRRGWALPALGVMGLFVAGLLLYPTEPSALIALAGYLGFLAVACVAGHGELVRRRPAGEHLTAFYLAVSVGGALGGFAVAVVAPRVLHDFYELPIAAASIVVAVAVAVLQPAAGLPSPPRGEGARSARLFLPVSVLLAILFGWSIESRGVDVLETRRDFFGVLRVERDPRGLVLMHGRVLHGAQLADPAKRRLATTYYAPASGVGRLLRSKQGPVRVGAIGLGVGTLAAYVKPGDEYRFYEISPTVVALAEGSGGYFTWLSDAPVRPQVVLGDARTSLEREPPNAYDVIVVDAFSGDSVPTHLLTKEAFELYRTHLASDRSVLALHVSNRYLNLLPVVARLARELGFHSLVVDIDKGQPEDWALSSLWVLLSKDPEALRLGVPADDASSLATIAEGPLWTDEFTSLWGLVVW
ncbi:MAG: fused MFS/spermidine synthase [Archangium sp.]|nr:fused MFS/spermidine synthase [Archangium sp.]